MHPRTLCTLLALAPVLCTHGAAALPKPKPKAKATAPRPAPPKPAAPRLSPVEQLFAAIEKGDAAMLTHALQSGADPNSQNKRENSALALAAATGSVELCRILIDRGASINTEAITHPLEAAVENAHLEVTRLLLDRGADPNWANPLDVPILSLAAASDAHLIIDLLLDKGAKLDPYALNYAIERDAGRAVARLLARGVDPLFKDDDGDTFLMAAARSGSVAMVELFVTRTGDVNAKDDIGKTALMHASGKDRDKIVAILKKAGAREVQPTLTEAVKQQDTRAVRLLLEKGADANEADPEGRTPLFFAAGGDQSILRALLEKGANPNARDKNGKSVVTTAKEAKDRQAIDILIEAGAEAPEIEFLDAIEARDRAAIKKALEEGADPNALDLGGSPVILALTSSAWSDEHLDTVRLLIERGAKLDVYDNTGASPLIHAAAVGSLKLVRELLDRGAPANPPDARLGSALMSVSGDDADAIIRLLIERGADVNARQQGGSTALCNIARTAAADTLRIALAKVSRDQVNIADVDNRTPLFIAAEGGKVENVKLLLEHGADPNVVETFDGKNALIATIGSMDAEADSRTEVVRLLIKHGAKVNLPDGHGRTPLEVAYQEAEFEIAEMLRDAGGTVPVRPKPTPATALSQAVLADDLDAVRAQLKRGVNPNIRDETGFSPLMVATMRGSLPMTRLLLAFKADPNFSPKDDWGREMPLPLQQAAEDGAIDIVRLLLKQGAKPNVNWLGDTPLSEAIQNDHYEVCQVLIAGGANVNFEPRPGLTAMTSAAQRSDPRFVNLLVAKGAEPDVVSSTGGTPLFVAVQLGRLETVRALLAAGANPKIVDHSGETTLMGAAATGNVELVQLLISKGVDINARSQRNRTALSVAQDEEKEEVVELLKRAGAKP